MARSKKTKNLVVWVIVGVMVLGLGGLGLNQSLQQSSSDVVFKVGKTEVKAEAYRAALIGRLNEIAANEGTRLSIQDARLNGTVNEVRQELINGAVIEEIARISGIEVPDEAVAAELQLDGNFIGASGQFNEALFQQFLDSNRISQKEYFDSIRRTLKRRMVIDILAKSYLQLPIMSGVLAEGVGEERELEFISLTAENLEEKPLIDETEIRSFYEENQEIFLGDPARKIAVAYALPDESAVTEAVLQSYFEEQKERFAAPPIVDYQLLAFATEEEAKAAIDGDFSALATARGLNEEDYIFRNQNANALLDENFKTALEDGATGYFGPSETPFGWNLYFIESYSPAGAINFDEIKESLRVELAEVQLNDELRGNFEVLNELRNAGAQPKALADAANLEFAMITLGEDEIKGLTDDGAFQAEALAANIGEKRDIINLGNGGIAYLVVDEEGEAKTKPFSSVHDEIRDQLEENAISAAIAEEAERLKSEIEGGKIMSQLAEENGLSVQIVGPLNQREIFSAVPISLGLESFQQEVGAPWISQDQNQYHLANLRAITALDLESEAGQEVIASIEEQLNGQITNELLLTLLSQASIEFGATINPNLAEQMEGQIR